MLGVDSCVFLIFTTRVVPEQTPPQSEIFRAGQILQASETHWKLLNFARPGGGHGKPLYLKPPAAGGTPEHQKKTRI
jgi:hypothetical protein